MAVHSGYRDADGLCDGDGEEMPIRGDLTPPYMVWGLGLQGAVGFPCLFK